VTYGLIAAICWGTSAVAATMAARRIGIYVAVLSAQGLGLVLLLLLALFVRPSLAGVHGPVALGLAGAGLVGLLGYLAFYRALVDGPVGLVSAISATYGGVTTLLAVVILGEVLGGPGTAGAVLAVGGVALATARSQAAADSPPVALSEPIVGIAPVPRPGPGAAAGRPGQAIPRASILMAFASALAYGIGGFLLGDYSARAGWLAAAVIAHGASVIALLFALPFLGRPTAWRGSASGVAWAAAAGVTDAIGLLAFSRGGQVGQVAITAAVSSINPVIPVIAGMVLFSERLGRRQLLGVGCIVAGLVLLGLTG
jgi:drug/metabolite transporter (DMT)-like permease